MIALSITIVLRPNLPILLALCAPQSMMNGCASVMCGRILRLGGFINLMSSKQRRVWRVAILSNRQQDRCHSMQNTHLNGWINSHFVPWDVICNENPLWLRIVQTEATNYGGFCTFATIQYKDWNKDLIVSLNVYISRGKKGRHEYWVVFDNILEWNW